MYSVVTGGAGAAIQTAPVGTICLASTGGPGGKLIEIGEFLNGEGFRDWEHAFLLGPNGKTLEAEPGGAVFKHISAHPKVYYCTAIATQFSSEQLQAVWDHAAVAYGPTKDHSGVGYSPEDYFALAAHRLCIPLPGLKDYIASTGHMICSQLCDQSYADKGCHVFDDKRWPGYVTPMSLYNRDQQLRLGV